MMIMGPIILGTESTLNFKRFEYIDYSVEVGFISSLSACLILAKHQCKGGRCKGLRYAMEESGSWIIKAGFTIHWSSTIFRIQCWRDKCQYLNNHDGRYQY